MHLVQLLLPVQDHQGEPYPRTTLASSSCHRTVGGGLGLRHRLERVFEDVGGLAGLRHVPTVAAPGVTHIKFRRT